MATKTATIVHGAQRSMDILWENLETSSDDGVGVAIPGAKSAVVQLLGTIGSGGAITMQGSMNGGSTWATLEDINSADVSLSALGIATIHELPTMIRPNATGGSSTDLDVRVVVNFHGD